MKTDMPQGASKNPKLSDLDHIKGLYNTVSLEVSPGKKPAFKGHSHKLLAFLCFFACLFLVFSPLTLLLGDDSFPAVLDESQHFRAQKADAQIPPYIDLSRNRSTDKPLTFVFFGDSLPGGIIPYIQSDLLRNKLPIDFRYLTVVSSTLSRPDFYDWPTEAMKFINSISPGKLDTAAVLMGANDAQNITVAGKILEYGTEAWTTEFTFRVRNYMKELSSRFIRVYWLGLPPMAVDGYAQRMESVSALYEKTSREFDNIKWIDLKKALTDANGFRKTYETIDGVAYKLFVWDGIHLETGSGILISRLLETRIKEDFVFLY